MAGLQAGVTGVFWMFGCFVLAAFWGGHSIWSVPNLYSTVFYGEDAFQDEFLRTSWAGLALIVVLYGLLGAIWGCWWKDERKPLLTFFGALTGLVTYYLFFGLIWPHLDASLSIDVPVRQVQVAHILWGAALAQSPGYSVRIFSATRPAAPAQSSAVIVTPPPQPNGHAPSSFDMPTGLAGASHPVDAPGDAAAQPGTQDDAESAGGELIR